MEAQLCDNNCPREQKGKTPNRLEYFTHNLKSLWNHVVKEVTYMKKWRGHLFNVQQSQDNIHMGSAWAHVGESQRLQKEKGTTKQPKKTSWMSCVAELIQIQFIFFGHQGFQFKNQSLGFKIFKSWQKKSFRSQLTQNPNPNLNPRLDQEPWVLRWGRIPEANVVLSKLYTTMGTLTRRIHAIMSWRTNTWERTKNHGDMRWVWWENRYQH